MSNPIQGGPLFGSWYIDEFLSSSSDGDIYRIKRYENCFVHYSVLTHVRIMPTGAELYRLYEMGKTQEEILYLYENEAKKLCARRAGEYDECGYCMCGDGIGYDVYFRRGDQVAMMDANAGYNAESCESQQNGFVESKPQKKSKKGGAAMYVLLGVSVAVLLIIAAVLFLPFERGEEAEEAGSPRNLFERLTGGNDESDDENDANSENKVYDYLEKKNVNDDKEGEGAASETAFYEVKTQEPAPTETQLSDEWHSGAPSNDDIARGKECGYSIEYEWKIYHFITQDEEGYYTEASGYGLDDSWVLYSVRESGWEKQDEAYESASEAYYTSELWSEQYNWVCKVEKDEDNNCYIYIMKYEVSFYNQSEYDISYVVSENKLPRDEISADYPKTKIIYGIESEINAWHYVKN